MRNSILNFCAERYIPFPRAGHKYLAAGRFEVEQRGEGGKEKGREGRFMHQIMALCHTCMYNAVLLGT